DVEAAVWVAALQPDAVVAGAERADEVAPGAAPVPGDPLDQHVHGLTVASGRRSYIGGGADHAAEMPQPARRLPGLRARRPPDGSDAHPRVDGDAAAGQPEHRVQVELGDLWQVIREPREAEHELDQRLR